MNRQHTSHLVHLTDRHLTDQEFYDLLDGSGRAHEFASPESGSPESGPARHLVACATCRVEFATLRDSVHGFRLAAGELSMAQTPARIRMTNDSSARPRFFTVPRAAWAGGLVAAMALCTASISILHRPAAAPVPAIHVAATPAADNQSDDALLEGIDSDLSTSVPPSLAPLETSAAAEKTTTLSTN